MKKDILIVDNDIDFINQLEIMLTTAGFAVDKVFSKAEAEKYIQDKKPDLAILDLMMETPDAGFALCYHIKKKYETLPVIIVTSVTSETGFEFNSSTPEGKSWIKADAFLSKPIRFEQLKREIDKLLEV
ncbi:MAG: response regulator [Anaerohalosphaeraceae bacterium]|nr:response regulator [Anaerohalosphaeraceae bacterium]